MVGDTYHLPRTTYLGTYMADIPGTRYSERKKRPRPRDTKPCGNTGLHPQSGKAPDQVSTKASGGRNSRLLKTSTNKNNLARTYGRRKKPTRIMAMTNLARGEPSVRLMPAGCSLIHIPSGKTVRGGRQVMATEQIRQTSSSAGVGNSKFQARQCSPPKTEPPTRAPMAT